VNNTADIFSSVSYISCCDPFFQLENNDERFEDDNNEKNLNLNYMRTSGSFLLHEGDAYNKDYPDAAAQ
jgi:hypothetical protein